jgi:hypothetical protein
MKEKELLLFLCDKCRTKSKKNKLIDSYCKKCKENINMKEKEKPSAEVLYYEISRCSKTPINPLFIYYSMEIDNMLKKKGSKKD